MEKVQLASKHIQRSSPMRGSMLVTGTLGIAPTTGGTSVLIGRQLMNWHFADLKTVSTALGHSTIAVTADTYAHISPAMLRGAAELLDRVVESGRKASGE